MLLTFMGVYHFTVNDHDEHCKRAAEILQKKKNYVKSSFMNKLTLQNSLI